MLLKTHVRRSMSSLVLDATCLASMAVFWKILIYILPLALFLMQDLNQTLHKNHDLSYLYIVNYLSRTNCFFRCLLPIFYWYFLYLSAECNLFSSYNMLVIDTNHFLLPKRTGPTYLGGLRWHFFIILRKKKHTQILLDMDLKPWSRCTSTPSTNTFLDKGFIKIQIHLHKVESGHLLQPTWTHSPSTNTPKLKLNRHQSYTKVDQSNK
jgi:hypothetical protein